MKKYFSQITQPSIVISKYFTEDVLESISWEEYIGWMARPVDESIYMKEPVLQKFNEAFPIERCAIMKLETNYVYDWHTDTERRGTINILLRGHDTSHTLFGEPLRENREKIAFEELRYRPETFYLFNTQYRHTVINFGPTRYMFSVEFAEHPTYGSMAKWAGFSGLLS
jgi:hypothetical protein